MPPNEGTLLNFHDASMPSNRAALEPQPAASSVDADDHHGDHEAHHHHHHRHGALSPISRATRIVNVLAVTLPFAGFLATIAYFWGWGFDWTQLAVFLVMFSSTGIGVTVGFHRYFTH